VSQITPPTPPNLPPKDRAPDSPLGRGGPRSLAALVAGLVVFAIGVAFLLFLR
jgi:hypothetical protein